MRPPAFIICVSIQIACQFINLAARESISFNTEDFQMPIDLEKLKSLSLAEKLELIEILWNDIAQSAEPIALRPWQLEEANRRASELQLNPSIAIDRKEMWRRVDD